MTLSPKSRQTRVTNLTSEWKKKTTLLPTCFQIIAMHSVCRCSRLKEGTPRPFFAPYWIRPWADLAEKQQHL